MLEYQVIVVQNEASFSSLGIFSILEQLVNEMRSVGIKVFDYRADSGVFVENSRQILTVPPNISEVVHRAPSPRSLKFPIRWVQPGCHPLPWPARAL